MKPPGTKKSHQHLGTKKMSRNLSGNIDIMKNHAKNHATSWDKKNHATSQNKNKKNTQPLGTKKITQSL